MLAPALLGLLMLSAPAAAAPQAAADTLDVLEKEGLRPTNLRLNLVGCPRLLSEDLTFLSKEPGRDAAGAFQRSSYRLTPAPTDPLAGSYDAAGELVLKRYANGVTLGSLDYRGPTLAADAAVQLQLSLRDFASGLAIHRYNPYWTGPVFSSDERLLPPDNTLLLWQRSADAAYQLLVPLAGEGLVAEVGVGNRRFGVTASAGIETKPARVPLFAFASGPDPYALAPRVYETAFASEGYYGRLRRQKPYPDALGGLGWCSWNAYYDKVREQDVLASVRSLAGKGVSLGFVLVDDGWLTTQARRLTAFDANASQFPHGLAWLASELRTRFKVPHVGVWHAFTGYWGGVAPEAHFVDGQAFLQGPDGQSFPDPRNGRGQTFFDGWYDRLATAGIDLVKVDNQAGEQRFTEGVLPAFAAAEGAQRNVQEAARMHFLAEDGSLGLINCMEMATEQVYSWRHSNLARTSNDYEPEQPLTTKAHLFQNPYNAYWIGNFAYPDYDMFVSDRPDAEAHAIARAVSGGPVYIADRPGHENIPLLRRLAFPDGRILRVDGPALPTRDTLLVDCSQTPTPLKLFATVARPGYRAGLVAAFNVDKRAELVGGEVHASDVEGLGTGGVALWERKSGRLALFAGNQANWSFQLTESEAALFTASPIVNGLAVLGLLDKYAGPAGVTSIVRRLGTAEVSLAGPGELGAYVAERPRGIRIDGKPTTAWRWQAGFLHVLPAAFGPRPGPRKVLIRL